MKDIMQENYKKLFFKKLNSLTENNKLFIYSKIKKKYETEPYLLKENNFEIRKKFTKLRVSDHILEIERGRYKNIKREERLCQHCCLNKIDDEEHFLFTCIKNKDLRLQFLQKVRNTYSDIDNMDDVDKLVLCLSCPSIMQYTAPFVKKSWSLRRVDSTTA